MTVLFIFSRLY